MLSAFAEWTAGGLPDELTAFANVLVAPPAPFLPPEVHGKQPEANLRWMRDIGARLDEFCTGAVYSNFMGDEGQDRTRAAYGGGLPRLQALKRAWDPDNVLRRNQNIAP